MPDLYFNRVPSLPATDDGSGRPLTEDLSTGSDDGEDIAWDADTAEAGEVPAAAGASPAARVLPQRKVLAGAGLQDRSSVPPFHHACQARQPPRRSRTHSARADPEYPRDLADIEVGVITQYEHLTLPARQ